MPPARPTNSPTPIEATARDLWVPAINNCGQFGRWAFVEITDPWDAGAALRRATAEGASA